MLSFEERGKWAIEGWSGLGKGVEKLYDISESSTNVTNFQSFNKIVFIYARLEKCKQEQRKYDKKKTKYRRIIIGSTLAPYFFFFFCDTTNVKVWWKYLILIQRSFLIKNHVSLSLSLYIFFLVSFMFFFCFSF